MTRPRISIAALMPGVGLAACQPAGTPAAPQTSAPVTRTPVTVPTAPVAMTAIPAQYLGKWDESAEACSRASIMTLTISANEVRFHESIGEIKTVIENGPDAITVAGPFDGEGQSWEGSLQLALSADHNTLTVTNNGTPSIRVRCT